MTTKIAVAECITHRKGILGGGGGGGVKGVIPKKAFLLSRHALLACRDT